MRNKLMILFVMILLLSVISLIIAGTLVSSDSKIKLTAEQSTLLKSKVKSINIDASPIICDDKICWSEIKQEKLIDSKFVTGKYYCSEYQSMTCLKYVDIETNDSCLKYSIPSCIKYKNYTKEELISLRDKFVKDKLVSYAEAIKLRNKSLTAIDLGGKITE